MNLLEDFKMSLLSFNFVMIYIIHKMFVLFKNHLNSWKIVFSNAFFKEYNWFFFNLFFSHHTMIESLSLEEENIIKDIRNLFKLKVRTKLHCT